MTEVEISLAINRISRALFDLELQAKCCKSQYKPTGYEAGMMMHTIREIKESTEAFEAALTTHILNN
jgi:hypothetical protein